MSYGVQPAGLDSSRLLFEDNKWRMYSWDDAVEDNYGPHASFLTHTCNGDKDVAEVYVFPDTHKRCWRCSDPLPDGIRALWIMHNGVI